MIVDVRGESMNERARMRCRAEHARDMAHPNIQRCGRAVLDMLAAHEETTEIRSTGAYLACLRVWMR